MSRRSGYTRPIQTLYGHRRTKPATYENALLVSRSCTAINAIAQAVKKMNERSYVRADICNEFGVHLYTIVRVDGGIVITRRRGERL